MRRFIITFLLLMTIAQTKMAAATKSSPFTGYLFAYFEGSGNSQEELRFAISEDARNWHALNNNQPIIASKDISESGGIRDPHLLRGENGEFFIVATDMHTFDPKQGWGANPGIVLMRSTDLLTWTHSKINLSKDYPLHFSDAHWVWAPQTIYDRKAKKYMIYFTLKRSNDNGLITYYAYANKDFTGFESEPKVLFRAKYESIDNDIIEGPDGTFHLFYKGNTKDDNGKEFKNGIQQATSKNLKGPWKEDFVYLDAYANTNTAVEGSSVFKLNDEEKWVLMYDLYGSGRYEYQTTTDLYHFTEKPESFTKDFFPRHGSVISVTDEELKRMQNHWGYVGVGCYEFESHGNPIIRHQYTADPAVWVEENTLWLFTGHDAKGDQRSYWMTDWCVFSTTDLQHWTQYPCPLRLSDFEWAKKGDAYAAQVIKRNDKYYWYVSTNSYGIGVAVSDRPEGPYHDAIGKPLLTNDNCFASQHWWACIDPTVFIDDDGQAYLIWGNLQCYIVKLKENMIETEGEVHQIDMPKDIKFTEAPWIHKYKGRYYLTYAAEFPEKIAYAVSDNIMGPWEYKGIISEIAGNSDTTHPAIVEFKGQWFFFSHNGGLDGGNSRHRSVIAEPMYYKPNGDIMKIHPSTEGVSILAPL